MGPNLSCECISTNSIKPTISSLFPQPLFHSRPDSLTSNSTSESAFKSSKDITGSPIATKLTIKDFMMLKVLGKGAYGKVLLVTRKRHPNKQYAMKIVQKSQVYKDNMAISIRLEKDTLKNSNSPFVVKLHYSFQTPTKIYLVMDYLSGGDLFHLLRKKKRFSLQTAKFYLAEVILALEYLHQNLKLIYRDLKPENILISGEGHLKITDFGLAKSSEQTCLSFVGTPEYVAPEVIQNQEQTAAVDIWSCGVLMYEMIAGNSPFAAGSKNNEEIQSKILKEEVSFPSFFTEDTKDLIWNMMRKNPSERISLGEIKKHRFFSDIDWRKVEKLELQTPFKAGEERVNQKNQTELKESYDLNSMPDLEGMTFNAEERPLDV